MDTNPNLNATTTFDYVGDLERSNIDAIQLTVLLKSIGFRLESFDFEENFDASKHSKCLEVEIKCQKAGIKARLTSNSNICSCPKENAENNNSFWEVQGVAPNTPKETKLGITDSSSNLLPNLQKNALLVVKTEFTCLLSKLNHFIENNIVKPDISRLTIAEIVERCTQIQENTKRLHELNNKSPRAFTLLHAESDEFITPLSSINVTPVAADHFAEASGGIPKIILPTLNDHNSDEENIQNNGIENPLENENFLTDEDKMGFLSPSSDVFVTSPNVKCDNNDLRNAVDMIKEAQQKLDEVLNVLQNKLPNSLSSCSTPVPTINSKNTLSVDGTKTTTRRHSLSVLPVNPLQSKTIVRKILPNSSMVTKKIVRPVMPQKNGTITTLSKPIKTASKILKPISKKVVETRSDTPRPFLSNNADKAAEKIKSNVSKVIATRVLRPKTNLTKVPSKSMPKLAD